MITEIQEYEHTNFNDIRLSLLNPSREASEGRKATALGAAICKGIFGVGEILGATITAVSLIAIPNIPLFALLAIPSFLMTLGSHEARVISQNVQELFDANLIVRSEAAISPERFTHAALKGTLVAECFFGSLVAKSL